MVVCHQKHHATISYGQGHNLNLDSVRNTVKVGQAFAMVIYTMGGWGRCLSVLRVYLKPCLFFKDW